MSTTQRVVTQQGGRRIQRETHHTQVTFYTGTGETAADLLYILGPVRGITEGHESTVGQDGEHDQHAEHRGGCVKEFPQAKQHHCMQRVIYAAGT